MLFYIRYENAPSIHEVSPRNRSEVFNLSTETEQIGRLNSRPPVIKGGSVWGFMPVIDGNSIYSDIRPISKISGCFADAIGLKQRIPRATSHTSIVNDGKKCECLNDSFPQLQVTGLAVSNRLSFAPMFCKMLRDRKRLLSTRYPVNCAVDCPEHRN